MDGYLKYKCCKQAEKRKRYEIILVITIILFLILISLGTIAFKYMFNLTWIDALYTATLIITSINIEVLATTTGQKLFIIIYALLVVVIFLAMANLAIQYLFHLII
jgi:hypothetical protein